MAYRVSDMNGYEIAPPAREPIALIGIGCRFPGAEDAESFWSMLCGGVDATQEYQGGRFDYIDTVFAKDMAHGGQIASRRGGFLPHLDCFDPKFFGISPREAAMLDPQQRLLLEVGWEAIEDAGLVKERIAGSRTGVFIGMWLSDYEACLHQLCPEIDLYANTGAGRYPASGRLSYFLNLRGPSMTVDTACSSSLVAVHLACQSLRLGESDMALAGGANVILRPEVNLTFSAAGMLSPEGRCKFGDASADGYVRSEGAGVVVLKRLSSAIADGDPIHALIRGSAVNTGGRSSGVLVRPSREGQEEVLREALRDAGASADEVDYVEAHGTGTPMGDRIEIESIGRVMAGGKRARNCILGSAKTNIGHTEAASGIAGVIKTALSLERRTIPGSLHFRNASPLIAWSELPVEIQTRTAPWPAGCDAPLAGVSGFGLTGTNAHAILQRYAAPPTAVNSAVNSDDRPRIFLLSAHTAEALRSLASGWRERLRGDASWPASMADLAYTAAVRRTHHEFRLAITAGSREELEEQLTGWLSGEERPGVQSGRRPEETRRTVFVFPGQGGQWAGMGRSLFQTEPVFRDAMTACDSAIRRHAGWSVIERWMTPGAVSGFEDIDVVQPALFAVMVSLAALWRSWGVEPDAVVGHSMGEAAAAAVSGALSLDDAAAVICHRSLLMKRASGLGAMAVAELPVEEAAVFAAGYGGRISVAAVNSPGSTVLSGDSSAMEDALAQLENREVFCRRVKVDVASHCAHMDPLRGELVDRLRSIQPGAGTIPLYSTTTGMLSGECELDAEYWGRNLREPVLFSPVIQRLLQDGFNTFIEINAHPILLQSVESGIRYAAKEALAVASLRRDEEEPRELLHAIGSLYANGGAVDFGRLNPRGVCLPMPAYPWQRERHWIEAGEGSAPGPATSRPTRRAGAQEYANCVYRLRWQPVETPPFRVTASAGLWIILSEPGAIAERLAGRIEALGEQCISAGSADDVRKAVESAGAVCRGVICDPFARGDDPAEASRSVRIVTGLIQALAAGGGLAHPPRLWLLSAGAWNLPGDSGAPQAAQGAVWGLARAIASEHPELRCVNVDLGSSPGAREFERLARLVCQDGVEDQLAVRGDRVFAARFERAAAVGAGEAAHFTADASYLITGGMGGIGLRVSRWLVDRGARHVALLGRRPPSNEGRAQIELMEGAGATVRTYSVDAADGDQLASVLASVACEMPPLRGVFHMAAVTEDALIAELTPESLERVMRAKAMSAWTLHRQTHDMPLDFFVMFSSVAAAISQPGQASYAASNAFLDALARGRRAEGLKAVSIQWGVWEGVGLGRAEGTRRSIGAWAEQGIGTLPTATALSALECLIGQDDDALVLPVDWDAFAHSAGNSAPRTFLQLIPTNRAGASSPVESVREKLLAIPAGARRRAALEAHLQEKLAAVLKTPVARVDPVKPFGSMGMDSLTALDFVRRLAASTSLPLSATIVFNYPTIQILAREIAKRMEIPLEADGPAVSVASAAGAPGASAAIALTDEEAIAILTGKGIG